MIYNDEYHKKILDLLTEIKTKTAQAPAPAPAPAQEKAKEAQEETPQKYYIFTYDIDS